VLFLFLWLIFFFSFHLFFFLALKASYADWITANALSSSATLAALCSAAALRRTHFSEARCSVVAADAASMVALLRGESGGATTRAVDAAAPQRRTALLFTGQGDVYTGMGAALFASQPVFRRELETVAALLREELAIPLLDVMFDAVHSAALKEARYTQPALFAVEWATAQMWEAWGLGAVAVAGHSLGEFAAAAVAGLLPLADVAAMVALRGRLIDALPARGGMLSVFASAEAVAEHVAGTSVSVAGINNPGLTTVAGALPGECSFIYRYIPRESCSQFDSLPLSYLTMTTAALRARHARRAGRWKAPGGSRARGARDHHQGRRGQPPF